LLTVAEFKVAAPLVFSVVRFVTPVTPKVPPTEVAPELLPIFVVAAPDVFREVLPCITITPSGAVRTISLAV
jgi:hypothetical protein